MLNIGDTITVIDIDIHGKTTRTEPHAVRHVCDGENPIYEVETGLRPPFDFWLVEHSALNEAPAEFGGGWQWQRKTSKWKKPIPSPPTAAQLLGRNH